MSRVRLAEQAYIAQFNRHDLPKQQHLEVLKYAQHNINWAKAHAIVR